MEKEHLKQIIADQKETYEARVSNKKFITREGFLSSAKLLKTPNVLLVSGMRRAGKSVLSRQIAGSMECASLNFDDERLMGFSVTDFDLLLSAFFELYGETDVILFDEIQNIDGWELFINRIREDHRIIITGSNANLLSSELSSHLTGRHDTLTLFPMRWTEYLSFTKSVLDPHRSASAKQKGLLAAAAGTYLQCGGIFEYYSIGKEHIRTLFGSIIQKDIHGRYAISFPRALDELALLLVNSFASKISISRLAGHLKIKSPHTVKEYLGYLENTFLIFTLEKWSYKLREQQSAAQKVYVMDTGIIDALSFSFSSNNGRLLENAVAVELLRRSFAEGTSVYYWDDYQHECDFIIKSATRVTAALQVCWELTEGTMEREKKGLVKAIREFSLKEGTIVTASQSGEETIEGIAIKIVPFYRWAATVSGSVDAT